jgi:hypothetical protein
LASRQSTIWPSIQILPSRSDMEGMTTLMKVSFEEGALNSAK